jgi:hypothetical protein
VRLQTLLAKRAYDTIETTTNHMDLIDIMQGFRKKFSNDMYLKLRKNLVDKKDKYFPNEGKNDIKRIENIVNTLYTLASNKPKHFENMQKVAN